MYNTSQKWKENIYKNVQNVLNIYIDEVLVNPDYILDFKVGHTLFDEELKLGSVNSKYIEFKIYKDKMYNNMKTVKVDYGILINNGLTVEEINKMLVGTLNGIKVKSLSKNNTSFEMLPIGIFNIDMAILWFIAYALHIIADSFTKMGVPFLYPFIEKKYGLKLIYASGAEDLFVLLVAIYIISEMIKIK